MDDLLGYGAVWYHPEAIENILSLCNLQNELRVMYGNTYDNKFIVHWQDGITQTFEPTSKGLYTSKVQANKLALTEKIGSTLVHMVSQNKSNFTKQYIKKYKDSHLL